VDPDFGPRSFPRGLDSQPALVVLDLGLETTGADVLQIMHRSTRVLVPARSVRHDEIHRYLALVGWADDFLPTPYATTEHYRRTETLFAGDTKSRRQRHRANRSRADFGRDGALCVIVKRET